MTIVEWDDDVYLDCYKPMLHHSADVKLYWGGRDSGKSYDIALELIEKCLSADTFKCLLIRKTFESVRDSQWTLLKTIVEDFGLHELFTFTKSPLEIRCQNGNSFIARGCDNPHNIKSVTNPTDAWYEEADKITYDEYAIVSTSLRSNDVQVQEWLSFNPEANGDYKESWLYDLVGESYGCINEFSRIAQVDGKDIEVKYVSCHTTFNDNPYCPPERRAKHISTTSGNEYLYNVYIHGRWGNRKTESPYLHNFEKSKHTGIVPIDYNYPLIFSFDFNVDPFACNVYQIYRDKYSHYINGVDEITLYDGDVFKMCEVIKKRYDSEVLSSSLYTGDAMQRKREITQRDNIDAWSIIRRELNISKQRMRVPKSNPKVKENRHLCNYILAHHPALTLDKNKCPSLINDCLYVEVDENGDIKKKNRAKEEQRADHLDNFRYLLNAFMPDFIMKKEKYI